MGKKARRKRERRSGLGDAPPKSDRQVTESYISQLGGRRPSFRPGDNDRFWDWLELRHGGEARTFSDAMTARYFGGDDVDVWNVKNASLELSLDVALGFSGDLYEKQIAWFSREFRGTGGQAPRRLLDLGCENGLLTCFYGAIWPNTEVVGLDASEAAFRVATELSNRLGLTNVQFARADFVADDLGSAFVKEPFDFIVSSRAIVNEAVPSNRLFASGRPRTDASLYQPGGWKTVETILEQLARIVVPGATLVTLERLPSAALAVWFVQTLWVTGFGIDWARSGILLADELTDERQEFPVFVANFEKHD